MLSGESDEFACHLVSIVEVMIPSFTDFIRYHSGTLLCEQSTFFGRIPAWIGGIFLKLHTSHLAGVRY